MKIVKNWKKSLVAIMAAITLTGSFATPVMAHGHHSSSSSSYCAYHGKTHKKKSSCKKYCAKHKTTHKNGKRHHS